MKAYNQLTNDEKERIVEFYYQNKEIYFKDIATALCVSERSIARVLKERGVNTRLKNRYTMKEDYFAKIDTEQKAYILGLLYADGYIGGTSTNNIILSLKEDDMYILECIKEELNFTGNIRMRERKGTYKDDGRDAILNFSNCKIAESLKNLGMTENKNLTRDKIPDIDTNLIRHFVRGYFDGDGSVTVSQNTSYYKDKVYRYATYTFAIIGGTDICNELIKVIPFEHHSLRKSKSDGIFYLTCSSKKDMPILHEYLYKESTIFLKRKRDTFDKIIGALSE